MVVLTVIRRLSIFVVAVALLINSVLLVLAKSARDGHAPQGQSYKVKAFVPHKATAYSLAKELKLEDGKYRVYDVVRERRVKTGGWFVEMQFSRTSAEQVEKMARTLNHLGFPVAMQSSDDGTRTVRLKQGFSGKAEASRKAAEILNKSNGLFQLSAVPATRKETYKAWCLEVAESDEETLRTHKQFLKGKATLDPR